MRRYEIYNKEDLCEATNIYCAAKDSVCDGCKIMTLCGYNECVNDKEADFLQHWIDDFVRAVNYINHDGERCSGCEVDSCRGFCEECCNEKGEW